MAIINVNTSVKTLIIPLVIRSPKEFTSLIIRTKIFPAGLLS